jgi:hypothetical protein
MKGSPSRNVKGHVRLTHKHVIDQGKQATTSIAMRSPAAIDSAQTATYFRQTGPILPSLWVNEISLALLVESALTR